MKTAPCGSRIAASRVQSVSVVDSTVAPRCSAAAAESSRSAIVNVTCQCGSPSRAVTSQPKASAKPGGTESPDCLSGIPGSDRGQVIAIPRLADHRRETKVVEAPPEHASVEVKPTLMGQLTLQVTEVPGARRVGNLGAGPPPVCHKRNGIPSLSTQDAVRQLRQGSTADSASGCH